jgi:hypothetical protein
MQAPPRKTPRRWLWWATGTLAAATLAVAIAEASGWPFLQMPLQNAMSRAAGVPVTLEGKFRTQLLWQPQLHIDHLQVALGGGAAPAGNWARPTTPPPRPTTRPTRWPACHA